MSPSIARPRRRTGPGSPDWADRDDVERRREIVTPEGIALVFRVARLGDRAVAFLIDLVIIIGSLLVVGLIGGTVTGFSYEGWLGALTMLLAFLLRNLYFIVYELRWSGSTPGKRALGLRVIDAHGGVLGADAVYARNLMREVEFFIPLSVLLTSGSLLGAQPGGMLLAAGVWMLVLVAMPCCNRDRLRVGDIVGGTLVVEAARAVLLPELGVRDERGQEPTFTREQLELYGIYELQVLEDLLRQPSPDPRTLATVAAKIQAKIGWSAADRSPSPRRFLFAFYESQRSRLEQHLLLGRARAHKQDGAPDEPT